MTTDVIQDPADALQRQMFHDAHTTHAFLDEPVDIQIVRDVYESVRWAPTAMNAQPLRMAVISSGEARRRLVSHMSEGNQAKTLAAPLTIVAAFDPNFHDHLDVLAPERVGARDNLEGQPEFRTSFAKTNGLIQVGYLILALRAAGLAVGPMTGMDPGAIDAELFSQSGWRTLVVLNVGHGPADHPDSVRPRAGRLDFDVAATIH